MNSVSGSASSIFSALTSEAKSKEESLSLPQMPYKLSFFLAYSCFCISHIYLSNLLSDGCKYLLEVLDTSM